MSGWETLNCENHPDRIAIERCEVCNKPLCAYCLYYTEDGQRLCAEHAELARLAGLEIEEPAAYADQLVSAQAGALRKRKRDQAEDDNLYKGNSTDLMSLIGLLIGTITLGACCGAVYCLPLVGFLLSLVAVINAGKAYDSRRTRTLGVIGLLVSGVWVVLIAGCILFYGWSLASLQTLQPISNPGALQTALMGPSKTPSQTPAATSTMTPTEDESDVAAFIYETPVPEAGD